ncbi:hypothetical protein GCM10007108_01930 [Thermogymnomonas acidicola]|uniref:Uncharacterized protein n=1 Tax=Thermogymnomonas acidicola TaxID=399579 RepID=A0AA37F8X3_9ARCH|nr:hypothetical protein [Thermogymnomonas acidicola]GGM67479.1 hypothetical protein GCM10007108_01930 [Thermogymnomonas acidicola]
MKKSYLDGNGNTVILGAIKGLVSDGNEVRDALRDFRPETVAATISPEEAEGLLKFLDSPFEVSISDYETIYGVNLSRFGEVMVPPPMFIEAARYCKENGVPLVGLDMDDEHYNEAYRRSVGTMALVRHSLRKNRVARKVFTSSSAEEFVDEWKREMWKVKGFRVLDMLRQDEVVRNIRRLMGEGRRLAVVCELEMYSDVLSSIAGKSSE